MTTQQDRWYYHHLEKNSETLTYSVEQLAQVSEAGFELGLSGLSSHILLTLVFKMFQSLERQSECNNNVRADIICNMNESILYFKQ